MLRDAQELDERRTRAWLELEESSMSQVEIGRLLGGLSQSSVSRAVGIADGRRDGPYTDDMNSAIDGYIRQRDEMRAKLARERREAAKRAAAERIRREEEKRRELLWDWIEGELFAQERAIILSSYRQQHNSLQPLTPDEELAVLARYLERKPGHPDPPVEITSLPLPLPTRTPVQPKPVARPEGLPRKGVAPPRTSGSPVRRNTRQPRRSPSPSVRSKSQGILVRCVLLAVVVTVVGIVVLASIEAVGQMWVTVSKPLPILGPVVLGIASYFALKFPVRESEPARGALWTMKFSAFSTIIISFINVLSLISGAIYASNIDRYLP